MAPLTRVVCAALLAMQGAALKADPKVPRQSNLAKHLEQIDHENREKNYVKTPAAVQDLLTSLPKQALSSLKLGLALIKEVNATVIRGTRALHFEMVQPTHGSDSKWNLPKNAPADMDRILFFTEPLKTHPQTAVGLKDWLEDVEQTSVALKVAMRKVALEIKKTLESGAVVHVPDQIPGMAAFAEFRNEEDRFRHQMLSAIQKSEWRAMQLVNEVEERAFVLATNSNFATVTVDEAMPYFHHFYQCSESFEEEQIDLDNALEEAKTKFAASFDTVLSSLKQSNTMIAKQLKLARKHHKA